MALDQTDAMKDFDPTLLGRLFVLIRCDRRLSIKSAIRWLSSARLCCALLRYLRLYVADSEPPPEDVFVRLVRRTAQDADVSALLSSRHLLLRYSLFQHPEHADEILHAARAIR